MYRILENSVQPALSYENYLYVFSEILFKNNYLHAKMCVVLHDEDFR